MKDLFRIHNSTIYTLEKLNEKGNDVIYTVKGNICHYNVKNQNHEIDLTGCFAGYIKQVRDNNQTVPLILNHNCDYTVGKVMEFDDGQSYLWALCKFSKTKDFIENILPLIDDGIYNCFSTEGWAKKGYWDVEKDGYIVEEGVLSQLSLVPQGSDLKANATYEEIKNSFGKKIEPKKFYLFDWEKK